MVRSHEDCQVLQRGALGLRKDTQWALTLLGLHLGVPKCYNMIISPESCVGGVYRRGLDLAASVKAELHKRDARLEGLWKTMDHAEIHRRITAKVP